MQRDNEIVQYLFSQSLAYVTLETRRKRQSILNTADLHGIAGGERWA